MGNFKCKKCGAGCSSKCPSCRSIFPDNTREALLSHYLKIYNKDGNIGFVVQYQPERTIVEEFKLLAETLELMVNGKEGYPTIEQYVCDHEWEGLATINCGHYPQIE